MQMVHWSQMTGGGRKSMKGDRELPAPCRPACARAEPSATATRSPSGRRWPAAEADGRCLGTRFEGRGSPLPVVKDMALTPAQLFRDIDRAMRGLDYRVEGQTVEAGTPERGLSISLRPLPPRRLGGLLSLDRSEVTISFRGYDERERAAFLDRFDRAYRRGGG